MIEIFAPDDARGPTIRKADISIGKVSGLTAGFPFLKNRSSVNVYVEISTANRLFETSTKLNIPIRPVDKQGITARLGFAFGGSDLFAVDDIDFDETISIEYLDEPLEIEFLVRIHELEDKNHYLGYARLVHDIDTTEEKKSLELLLESSAYGRKEAAERKPRIGVALLWKTDNDHSQKEKMWERVNQAQEKHDRVSICEITAVRSNFS